MKKTGLLSAFVVLAGSISISSTHAAGWNGYNNPANISRSYEYRFDALPLEGQLDPSDMPWSETYWPTNRSGVAYRWSSKTPAWNYRTYTREQLQSMSAEQIGRLSPAEKFDIWQGRYDYPTVNRERSRTYPNAVHWAGLCHGWAPAALLHVEPQTKTFTNPDGIAVPFGSSDAKGMAIYYYGVVDWDPSGWIGQRCRGGLFPGAGCNGVNAGTLHVVIANQIGIMRRGFIADIDRWKEIWNQPVYKFSSRVLGRGTRTVEVETVMEFVDEYDFSQWEPGNLQVGKRTYRYTLEVNAAGEITGGTWRSDTRPGFLWQHDLVNFADPYYGRVAELLDGNTRSIVPADSALDRREIRDRANEALLPPSE